MTTGVGGGYEPRGCTLGPTDRDLDERTESSVGTLGRRAQGNECICDRGIRGDRDLSRACTSEGRCPWDLVTCDDDD